MNTCSAAHDKSTEAPVPLPEASAARVPVTTAVAGDRFLLRSILYKDPKKTIAGYQVEYLGILVYLRTCHCVRASSAAPFDYACTTVSSGAQRRPMDAVITPSLAAGGQTQRKRRAAPDASATTLGTTLEIHCTSMLR